ncbi:MAG: hypothetical protein WCF53_21500, partial [Pseudolabrys sp.]
PAAAVRQRRLLGSRSLLLVNPWAMPVIGFLQKTGDFKMKNVTLSLLAAAAIGAISIGSVSAMPVNNLPGLGENHFQDVRLVCDRFGRCYNTRRAYRPYYAQGYYGQPGYGYYGQPSYGYYGQPGYGYYGGPRVGVGPFSFGW